MLQTFSLLPDIIFRRNKDTLYKAGIKNGTKFTLYRLVMICEDGSDYPLFQSIDRKEIDREIEKEKSIAKAGGFHYRIEENHYLITEIKAKK